MGTAAQPAELSELIKNMKVDTHTKGADVAEAVPKNDGVLTDLNRVVSSPSPTSSNGDFTSSNGWVPETCVYYASGYPSHGYVYDYGQGGGEWDEYSQQYVGINAADLHSSGLYTENGSVLYHTGYGYPPSGAYGPYTSGPIHAIGADGQLYGPAAFQYPGAIYQTQGTQYLSPVVMGGDSVAENGTMASSCATTNVTTANMASRPGFSMALIAPHNPYQRGLVPMAMHNYDSRYPSWNEKKERKSKPATNRVGLNTGNGTTQSSQNFKTSVSQAASTPALPGALGKGFPPLSKTIPNSNGSAKSGAAPSSNGTGKLNGGTTNGNDLKATNNVWNSLDKVKQNGGLPVSSNNCSSNGDILDEQNKGPRTRVKAQRPCLGIVKHFRGQNGIPNGNVDCVPATKEQYNKSDFVTSYDDARFFVIKSYSEDDVHKSIKYNVWASTPNGNKRLDTAYQEAQSRAASKGRCPVFLFFSVNASGQFCGLAEMCGSVDFNKSMDFWQQDKWNGRFSVKWHVIKDIPNSQFRHIILENNDNKPVTNSRDTQEVKFQQGIEMLKIFKSYPSKASILDDFQFYENRQRAMQEKRFRHQLQNSHQGQQQISNLVAVKAHTDEVPNNLEQTHGNGNGKMSHLAGVGLKPAATEIENADTILKSERLLRPPIEKGDDKPEMAAQNFKEELQVKLPIADSEKETKNSEVEVASEEGEKKRERLSSGISNEEKAVE